MSRQPVRVLIVDDDRFVQCSVAEFIEAAGDLECAGACGNGAEAVVFVDAHPVDVVLMDVQMPVMDGVEGARLILQAHPRVRVLMWTSFDNDAAVATAMRHGAAGFLLKTCTARTLIDAIRTAHGGMTVLAPDSAARAAVGAAAGRRRPRTHRPRGRGAGGAVPRAVERGDRGPPVPVRVERQGPPVQSMQKLDAHTRARKLSC